MADFPTDLSELQDNIDDVLSKHINNLEQKVGTDGSADTNSLDYKIEHVSAGANVLEVQVFS